jgi:large subunit ribosomal protein L17
MRHLKKGRSLGRKSSHRVRTTEAKAKEVRGLVDRIITWGKRGDVHARRLAARQVRSRTIVKKVFDELAPRYRDRPGGYTRIMKIGFRHGDNAPEVIMELVDHPTPER